MRAKRCSLKSEYPCPLADNRTSQVRIGPTHSLPIKYNSMPSPPMSGNVRFCPVFPRCQLHPHPTFYCSTTYSSFPSCIRPARPDIRQPMSHNVPKCPIPSYVRFYSSFSATTHCSELTYSDVPLGQQPETSGLPLFFATSCFSCFVVNSETLAACPR